MEMLGYVAIVVVVLGVLALFALVFRGNPEANGSDADQDLVFSSRTAALHGVPALVLHNRREPSDGEAIEAPWTGPSPKPVTDEQDHGEDYEPQDPGAHRAHLAAYHQGAKHPDRGDGGDLTGVMDLIKLRRAAAELGERQN